MSPALVPITAEVLTTLLFAGVLFYLRKSLTRRSLAFWTILWIVRGVASLFVIDFVGGPERLGLVVSAPLQVLFAIALVVIAMRLENQKQQLRVLNEELTRLRREASSQIDLDPLTGLRNRSALARWMEEDRGFQGLVVVCDMDDFKLLNDSYGHLVGDEILHSVGKLISNSIREEDLAFRWGGDEFVIFFHSLDTELVESRMRQIEERLQHFHIRQHGTIAVHFSWGITTTADRRLREGLDEADRLMYEAKRARRDGVKR